MPFEALRLVAQRAQPAVEQSAARRDLLRRPRKDANATRFELSYENGVRPQTGRRTNGRPVRAPGVSRARDRDALARSQKTALGARHSQAMTRLSTYDGLMDDSSDSRSSGNLSPGNAEDGHGAAVGMGPTAEAKGGVQPNTKGAAKKGSGSLVLSIVALTISAVSAIFAAIPVFQSDAWRIEDRDLPAKAVMLLTETHEAFVDNATGEMHRQQAVTAFNGGAMPINMVYLALERVADEPVRRLEPPSGTESLQPRGDERSPQSGANGPELPITGGDEVVCEADGVTMLKVQYLESGERVSTTRWLGAGGPAEPVSGIDLYFRDAYLKWWRVGPASVAEEAADTEIESQFAACMEARSDSGT